MRNGKCVRLYQGDYDSEIVFNDNPLEAALLWQSLGAPRIHIVDLDGAASGNVVNLEIIESIASVLQVPIQMGGGIRTLDTISRLLKMGVERVILGTAAVEDTGMVREACRRYAESIIVSVDARNGLAATWGWIRNTQLRAIDLARDMAELGVGRFIYTDITRDGTLTEPNYAAISALIEAVSLPVIAAGGISSIEHLRALKRTGAEGAIIGKALYTGDLDLKEALQLADG